MKCKQCGAEIENSRCCPYCGSENADYDAAADAIQQDEARQNILDEKFSHIIVALSEQHNISIEQAMDIFYNSTTSQLIEEGFIIFIQEDGDVHCSTW